MTLSVISVKEKNFSHLLVLILNCSFQRHCESLIATPEVAEQLVKS